MEDTAQPRAQTKKNKSMPTFRNSHCPCTFPFRLSSTILYYLPDIPLLLSPMSTSTTNCISTSTTTAATSSSSDSILLQKKGVYTYSKEKKDNFCFLSSELRTLLYFILMGSNFLMACCTDNGVQPAKSSSSTSIMPFLAQRSWSLYGKRMQKKCKHGIQWPFILKSTSPSYTYAHTRNENTFPVLIRIIGLSDVACRTKCLQAAGLRHSTSIPWSHATSWACRTWRKLWSPSS